MNFPLRCPTCGNTADYSLDDLAGVKIAVYKGSAGLRELPDPIVVSCKNCPSQFEISRDDVTKASESRSWLKGGGHGG